MKKITEQTQIKGHKVAASEDNPEYLVRPRRQQAAHKPSALDKR